MTWEKVKSIEGGSHALTQDEHQLLRSFISCSADNRNEQKQLVDKIRIAAVKKPVQLLKKLSQMGGLAAVSTWIDRARQVPMDEIQTGNLDADAQPITRQCASLDVVTTLNKLLALLAMKHIPYTFEKLQQTGLAKSVYPLVKYIDKDVAKKALSLCNNWKADLLAKKNDEAEDENDDDSKSEEPPFKRQKTANGKSGKHVTWARGPHLVRKMRFSVAEPPQNIGLQRKARKKQSKPTVPWRVPPKLPASQRSKLSGASVQSYEREAQESRHARTLHSIYMKNEDIPRTPGVLNAPRPYDEAAVPRVKFKSKLDSKYAPGAQKAKQASSSSSSSSASATRPVKPKPPAVPQMPVPPQPPALPQKPAQDKTMQLLSKLQTNPGLLSSILSNVASGTSPQPSSFNPAPMNPSPQTTSFNPSPMTHSFNPSPMTHSFNPSPMTHSFDPSPMTHSFNPSPMTHSFNPRPMNHHHQHARGPAHPQPPQPPIPPRGPNQSPFTNSFNPPPMQHNGHRSPFTNSFNPPPMQHGGGRSPYTNSFHPQPIASQRGPSFNQAPRVTSSYSGPPRGPSTAGQQGPLPPLQHPGPFMSRRRDVRPPPPGR